MNHIFGDSHDITFGDKKSPNQSPKAEKFEHVPQKKQHSVGTERRHHPNNPSPRSNTPRPASSHVPEVAPKLPLERLIDGMKSSFLPKEEDPSAMRMVILSEQKAEDPLMMFSLFDATILLGSGFGKVTRAGKTYSTFPDMRLLSSEKQKIQGWILPNENVEIEPFLHILPVLNFPPIYGSRNTIAKFRNSVKDQSFLEKCRFFEILPQGQSSRLIGDFEFSLVEKSLAFSFRGTKFVFSSSAPAGNIGIFATNDTYMVGKDTVLPGEIVTFRGKSLTKNPLKFTFDTFYVDAGSVGVLAGYTLSDREVLSENGVLIFTLEEDTRLRTITGHIFIDSRGFVHAHEMMGVHKEVLKGIRSTYEKCITENPKIDRSALVQSLRREVTKYCYVLTGRTPVVMPILIER